MHAASRRENAPLSCPLFRRRAHRNGLRVRRKHSHLVRRQIYIRLYVSFGRKKNKKTPAASEHLSSAPRPSAYTINYEEQSLKPQSLCSLGVGGTVDSNHCRPNGVRCMCLGEDRAGATTQVALLWRHARQQPLYNICDCMLPCLRRLTHDTGPRNSINLYY